MERDFNGYPPYMDYNCSPCNFPEMNDVYKDPFLNPMMQYEQACSYYRYLCMQMDYKIKCKEYDRMCNHTNSTPPSNDKKERKIE